MIINKKIFKTIKRFITLDYGRYTKEVQNTIVAATLHRIYIFSFINLFILLGLFIVDYQLYRLRFCENYYPYCYILYSTHLFMLTISVTYLFVYKFLKYESNSLSGYPVPFQNFGLNKILQYVMVISYFMVFTFISIAAQFFNGSIIVYFLGSFTIATVALLPPLGSFLVFTSTHIVFLTFIIFIQDDQTLLFDNIPNGTVAYLLAMVLNIMMTRYRSKNIINERLIKNTSEQLNKKIEIIEEEITLAKRIQEQLIPGNPPDKIYSSLYKPMHLIGGDFFDFVHFQDQEKTGFFISDVSGHGVPAAFITAMIKTILLQSGTTKENPAELLCHMNDALSDKTGGNFITAFYGIYDLKTRSLLFANAGHNEPFIIQREQIHNLHGKKSIPLGLLRKEEMAAANKIYSNSSAILPKNSKLLLYTDGLLEATPLGKSISFEENGIMQVMIENYHEPSASFIQNIYKELSLFRGEESFDDDVCLLCVDIN